jgi:hypothetical protein
MGWLILPKPGTELGPCVEECKHTDCAATRKEATAPCSFCGDPIGYDVKFQYNDGKICHMGCLWKSIEEED